MIWPLTRSCIAAMTSSAGTYIMTARDRHDRGFGRARRVATLVATLSVLASSLAAAAAETLAVQGNRRVDAETVRSYFHADANGRYQAAALDDGLKALVATGLFEDVKIDRTDGRTEVRVSEAKALDRVAFEGNKKVKDADLAAAVLSKPRAGLQRATVQGDVARIIQAYHHAGRDDVRVVPEIIDRGNDRLDLVFTITEGKKTPVRAISFVGNQAYGARQLRAVIKTSATNVLSFVTGGNVYDADRVNEDREQLRQYYRNHGYADAEVTNVRVDYDTASSGYNLIFAIEEGPLYRFGAIDVACDVPGLACERLSPQVLAQQGDAYDEGKLGKTAETLTAELAKLGFPFAQVEPIVNRNAQARLANITFRIEQGQRSYVERIEIHGNTRTRDDVIRREFDIGEGDAYNKTLIDRAERRLKNLNYFKSVKITNEPGSAPDRIVINVTVVEQPTGEFAISGGYSTADGFLGEVSVGERNLLGRGQYARVAVQYGQYTKGFELGFVEPYLLGQRIALGIDIFAKER